MVISTLSGSSRSLSGGASRSSGSERLRSRRGRRGFRRGRRRRSRGRAGSRSARRSQRRRTSRNRRGRSGSGTFRPAGRLRRLRTRRERGRLENGDVFSSAELADWAAGNLATYVSKTEPEKTDEPGLPGGFAIGDTVHWEISGTPVEGVVKHGKTDSSGHLGVEVTKQKNTPFTVGQLVFPSPTVLAKGSHPELVANVPDDDEEELASTFANLPAGSVRTYQTPGALVAWTKGVSGYWSSDTGSKLTSSELVNWIDDTGATLSSTTVGASGAPKGPDDFDPTKEALDLLPEGSVRKWKTPEEKLYTATKQGSWWNLDGPGIEGLYSSAELSEWAKDNNAKILPGAGSTPGAPSAPLGSTAEWTTKLEKLGPGDAIKTVTDEGHPIKVTKTANGKYDVDYGGPTPSVASHWAPSSAATALVASGADISKVLVADEPGPGAAPEDTPEPGSITKAAGLPSVKAADVKVNLEGMPEGPGAQEGYVLYRPDGSKIQFKRFWDGSYRAIERKKTSYGFSSGKVVKKKTTNVAGLAKWAEKEGLLPSKPDAPVEAPATSGPPVPPAKMTAAAVSVAILGMPSDSVHGFETAADDEPNITVWRKGSGSFSVKAVGGPPGSSTVYSDPGDVRSYLVAKGATKALGQVSKATGLPVGSPPAPVAAKAEPDDGWGSLPTGYHLRGEARRAYGGDGGEAYV